MKTKIFLILNLLVCFTLTRLSAQNGNKDGITGSFVSRGTSEAYLLHVYCEDIQVDELVVTTPFLYTDHYQKGIWVWRNSLNIGEVTSLVTGEVFRLKDFDRITITNDVALQGTVIERVNLIGNKGSHYIFTYTYEFPAWKITSVIKTSCPGLSATFFY